MLEPSRSRKVPSIIRIGRTAPYLAFGFLLSIVCGWMVIDVTTNGFESEPAIPHFILEGIVIGAVISPFQWFALRKTGIGLARFTLASAAGLAVAWPIGEVLSDPAGWVVSFMIFGLGIGLAQLLVLRHVLANRFAWVGMSSLAWMSSSLAAVADGDALFLFLLLGGSGLFGLILAVSSGLILKGGPVSRRSQASGQSTS